MSKAKKQEETAYCPVGRFFADLENMGGKDSLFFKHLNQSRIEFLKAIKSLVDERIETIEKKQAGKPKKKMRKIEVE